MSTDLAYDPQTRKRPRGASAVTLRVYAALVEHAGRIGLTVDGIDEFVRDGFPTDSYRAYQRHLQGNRATGSRQLARSEFGSDEFRRRARRWAIGRALQGMRAGRTARRHPDDRSRWLAGERAPNTQKAWEVRPGRIAPIVAAYDPAGDRAKMQRYHATTRAIANAEEALAKTKLTTADAHRMIAELLALIDRKGTNPGTEP